MSLKVLNPNAEVLNKSHALHMTINAAKGLHDVLKSRELIGGVGDIKLTKDRNTLSIEMQIQSPTAIMIARPAEMVPLLLSSLLREHDKHNLVGLNLDMGEPIDPQMEACDRVAAAARG